MRPRLCACKCAATLRVVRAYAHWSSPQCAYGRVSLVIAKAAAAVPERSHSTTADHGVVCSRAARMYATRLITTVAYAALWPLLAYCQIIRSIVLKLICQYFAAPEDIHGQRMAAGMSPALLCRSWVRAECFISCASQMNGSCLCISAGPAWASSSGGNSVGGPSLAIVHEQIIRSASQPPITLNHSSSIVAWHMHMHRRNMVLPLPGPPINLRQPYCIHTAYIHHWITMARFCNP
jgi:hypothetical protein